MNDIVWLAIALGACATVIGFIGGFILGVVMVGKPDVLRDLERMGRDY